MTFEQWIIDESSEALEELCFKNFDDPREFLAPYNGDSISQLTSVYLQNLNLGSLSI